LVSYNFFNNRNTTLAYADPTLSPYLGTLSAWSMTMASGITPISVSTGWGSSNYVNVIVDRDAAIAANEYFTIPIFSTGSSTIIINSAVGLTVNRAANSPRFYSFLYNFVGDPSIEYTFIATATAQTTSPQEIWTQLNDALNINPITIPPGSTAYIYVVPFSGTGIGANTSFINTDAASEDFKFSGLIL
jgi:hypothetical protein